MSATHHIRSAVAADVPALVELLAVLFGIEQDFAADRERQTRGLLAVIGSPLGEILAACDTRGRVVGMCSGQLVFSTAEGAASVWVEDVVVSEAWRGQGIGRALLAGILDWAAEQGATRAQLLVDLDNQPALDFYRDLGG